MLNAVEDIRRAREDGAAGVGLFRSEFLFLQGEPPARSSNWPAYLEALNSLDGATADDPHPGSRRRQVS